jgi:NAD(P)H-quinone oxidoreductase subunit 5
VIISFGALTVFQNLLPYRQDKASWQSLYALISNGLYVNTLANRWVIRLWPSPPPRRTHALHANVQLKGVEA